jgi:hypothetical protein
MVNYLLLPWPLRIQESDFRPVTGPLQRLANDPFGFFEFNPSERLDLDLADRTLAAARDQAGTVDVVIDGPQLSSRWGARYAGVLADDPGSAVLTLTSFGMTQRSRPPGRNPSRVVALWKGHGQLAREIPLDPGAHAILLSATVGATIRRSFDGRRPGHDGSEFSSVSVRQIRASSHGTQPAHAPVGPWQRLGLTADELTILTSWAEAFAEALAFSPASIEDLAADARSGASWREELGVCEPSPLLRQSINGIAQIAQAAVAAGGTPPIAIAIALLAADQGQPGEPAVEGQGCAVLRSALLQRQPNGHR